MHFNSEMCEFWKRATRKSRFGLDLLRKRPRPDERLDPETQRKVLRQVAERLNRVNGRPEQ